MLGFGGGGGGVDRDICWPNIKLNRVLAIADWTSFRFLYVVCNLVWISMQRNHFYLLCYKPINGRSLSDKSPPSGRTTLCWRHCRSPCSRFYFILFALLFSLFSFSLFVFWWFLSCCCIFVCSGNLSRRWLFSRLWGFFTMLKFPDFLPTYHRLLLTKVKFRYSSFSLSFLLRSYSQASLPSY